MAGPNSSAEIVADIVFEKVGLAQVAELLTTDIGLLDAPANARIALAATYLHGFYNGIERCLVFIRALHGMSKLQGDGWHQQLLGEFRSHADFPYDPLKQLLGFRHVFRHAYLFELRGNPDQSFSCGNH
jgi:hypothetical protein